MSASSSPGWHVVELELIATAAGSVPLGEQRTQPGEQLDGAEVVDRDQQRCRALGEPGQAGQRDQPVERAPRELGDALDRRRAALGGAEVGLHLARSSRRCR